jgi:hypothetical protein
MSAKAPRALRMIPIDATRFILDTRLMSQEGVAAYIQLLCFLWGDGRREPRIPISNQGELSRVAGFIDARSVRWHRAWADVSRHMAVKDGYLSCLWLTKAWQKRRDALARVGATHPANARPGSRRREFGAFSRGAVDPQRRVRLLERDGNKCVWCGSTERLVLDHVIPVALGGDNSDDNYQVLCRGCNSKKGSWEETG